MSNVYSYWFSTHRCPKKCMQSKSYRYDGNGNVELSSYQFIPIWIALSFHAHKWNLQNFAFEIFILFLISFQEEFCFWIPTLSNGVCVCEKEVETTCHTYYILVAIFKTAFSPQRTYSNTNTSNERVSERKRSSVNFSRVNAFRASFSSSSCFTFLTAESLKVQKNLWKSNVNARTS